ncbi:hypothetical protein [Sporosarcina sp. SAFN-015]|uniref:hypothetical protein n=1 Tax=Sporosarcina sp. SAFN-015 TaxID=3387274 RepID=UPI003F7DECCB
MLLSIVYFIIGFVKQLFFGGLGLGLVSLILGFLFPPALFVVVPLGVIGLLISCFTEGKEMASDYLAAKQANKYRKRNIKAAERKKKKLRKVFDEHELFEFDRALREVNREFQS